MSKLLLLLRNKKTQYALIIWILILKIIEIIANLSADLESLGFLTSLGFPSLSPTEIAIWNGVFLLALIWLITRLLKDFFNVSLLNRPKSKEELASLSFLILWSVFLMASLIQFSIFLTESSTNPELEISKYYMPSSTSLESTSFVLTEHGINDVVVADLSKTFFLNPFSTCKSGIISESGTAHVGASYFIHKNSTIGQEMLEISFHGNGSNYIQGWFSNKISLFDPSIPSENKTLMLLLRITKSNDESAWTYLKLDFTTEAAEEFSVIFKFYEVPMNYAFLSGDNTRITYNLGSVVDWSFYQFDLNEVFYTSFSKYPLKIRGIEFGVGSEADNAITAQFLMTTIAEQPLEINEMRVLSAKPPVNLGHEKKITVTGLTPQKLLLVLTPTHIDKKSSIQLSLLEILKTESFAWNTTQFVNIEEAKIALTKPPFDSLLMINGEQISLNEKGQNIYELDPEEREVTLAITISTDLESLPPALILTIIAPLIILLKYKHREISFRNLLS